MNLIYLYTITAHFFVDFYLQSDVLIKRKHNEIKAHLWHSLTHSLAFYIGTFISVLCAVIAGTFITKMY